MTAEQFKKNYPHLSHLEGNDLWNAMEDAWLIEHKNDKLKEITDWKGNVIKDGDEICTIRIRTGGYFKNGAIMMPDGKGNFTRHEIPDEPDEDCWEIVGKYYKVENGENGLFYTIKSGEYTFNFDISILFISMDKKHVLAIKGKSDNKNEYYETKSL